MVSSFIPSSSSSLKTEILCSQGHLVELKLAALRALSYKTFFDMFGSGKLPNFRRSLDTELSPWLSSAAYQFWKANDGAFDRAFYRRGYSGWALRVTQVGGILKSRSRIMLILVRMQWVLWLGGVLSDAKRMCGVDTIEEQERIWREKASPRVRLYSLFLTMLRVDVDPPSASEQLVRPACFE